MGSKIQKSRANFWVFFNINLKVLDVTQEAVCLETENAGSQRMH